jgi:hypothetical protein
MKKSFTCYILMFLLLFQSITAIAGGWGLVSNPSGSNLGFSVTMLEHSPFPDFLIPGLFLLVALGIGPAVILYGLIRKPKFRLAEIINIYKNYHWSWTFSYYLGIVLVLWIDIQVYFLREASILHFVYSVLGVLIIVVTNLPATKKCYRIH